MNMRQVPIVEPELTQKPTVDSRIGVELRLTEVPQIVVDMHPGNEPLDDRMCEAPAFVGYK